MELSQANSQRSYTSSTKRNKHRKPKSLWRYQFYTSNEVSNKIIHCCHQTLVETPTGEKIGFTTSIGLATATAEDTVDSLLKRADEALYGAKDNGRDQVQLAA